MCVCVFGLWSCVMLANAFLVCVGGRACVCVCVCNFVRALSCWICVFALSVWQHQKGPPSLLGSGTSLKTSSICGQCHVLHNGWTWCAWYKACVQQSIGWIMNFYLNMIHDAYGHLFSHICLCPVHIHSVLNSGARRSPFFLFGRISCSCSLAGYTSLLWLLRVNGYVLGAGYEI